MSFEYNDFSQPLSLELNIEGDEERQQFILETYFQNLEKILDYSDDKLIQFSDIIFNINPQIIISNQKILKIILKLFQRILNYYGFVLLTKPLRIEKLDEDKIKVNLTLLKKFVEFFSDLDFQILSLKICKEIIFHQ